MNTLRNDKEKGAILLLGIASVLFMVGALSIGFTAVCLKQYWAIPFALIALLSLAMAIILWHKGKIKQSEYLSKWKDELSERLEREMRTRLALQRTTIEEDEFRRANILRMQIASGLGLEELIPEKVYEEVQMLLNLTFEELEEKNNQICDKLEYERKRISNRVCEIAELNPKERNGVKKAIKDMSLSQLDIFEKAIDKIKGQSINSEKHDES